MIPRIEQTHTLSLLNNLSLKVNCSEERDFFDEVIIKLIAGAKIVT